jgi:hypothetical protein
MNNAQTRRKYSMHECRYQNQILLSHTLLSHTLCTLSHSTLRLLLNAATNWYPPPPPSPQVLVPHSAEADKAQCVFPPSTAILFKDKCVTPARCFMGCAKWFQWPVPGG